MTADTQAQGDLDLWRKKRQEWRKEINRLEEMLDSTNDPKRTEAFAAALQGRGTQEGEQSDERAAFEAWYEAVIDPNATSADWFQRDAEDPGEYYFGNIHCAWLAWQARAALAQESRVSVEIREAM